MSFETSLQRSDSSQLVLDGLGSDSSHSRGDGTPPSTQDYTRLQGDYERLKCELEEARDARDRYKQMVKGKAEDSFVLVLIDADGYIFHDTLVQNGTKGGEQAAELLQQIVTSWLAEDGLDHCAVKVQAYGNVRGLSTAMYHARVSGWKERSFTSFAAGFTQFNGLCDFVDSGRRELGTQFKVLSTFLHHIKQASCRHIYFAGCHNAKYSTNLAAHLIFGAPVTLIDTSSMHPSFVKLGLPLKELSSLFQGAPRQVAQDPIPKAKTFSDLLAMPVKKISDRPSSMKPFVLLPDGYSESKSNHKFSSASLSQPPKQGGISNVNLSQQKSGIVTNHKEPQHRRPKVPSQLTTNAAGDHKTARHGVPKPKFTNAGLTNGDLESILMSEKRATRGLVALNSGGHRLDPFLPPPEKQSSADFIRRHSAKQLCNSYHLIGFCEKGDRCTYDHRPISLGVHNMLMRKSRSKPCRKGGACRMLFCMAGHICQFSNCQYRGGNVRCKMGPGYHFSDQDLKTVQYVRGEVRGRKGCHDTASMSSNAGTRSPTPSTSQASEVDRPKQQIVKMPQQEPREMPPLIAL
nr:hypothetical protein CFP56_20506 [Quercus suber]